MSVSTARTSASISATSCAERCGNLAAHREGTANIPARTMRSTPDHSASTADASTSSPLSRLSLVSTRSACASGAHQDVALGEIADVAGAPDQRQRIGKHATRSRSRSRQNQGGITYRSARARMRPSSTSALATVRPILCLSLAVSRSPRTAARPMANTPSPAGPAIEIASRALCSRSVSMVIT